MQCCNKHVIIYSGARVSELIRAIRSFISIDVTAAGVKKYLVMIDVALSSKAFDTLSLTHMYKTSIQGHFLLIWPFYL